VISIIPSDFQNTPQFKDEPNEFESDNLFTIRDVYTKDNTYSISESTQKLILYKEKFPITKCLIIAAGRGSRLSDVCESKPLLSILGLKLIERVILSAKEAGLTDFYIVIGYNDHKVREFLDKLSIKKDIKINYLYNFEWKKGNGISVLKSKKYLNENFVLLMSDHIFDPSILVDLLKEDIEDEEIKLVVDYNIDSNRNIDIDDATKVLVYDDLILDIGKNIDNFNAFDTGIFLCSPIIFDALEESIENGDDSLSGGIKILAERGNAKVFDIKDKYWIDIDDKLSYKKAKRLLISNLKKKSDGPVSRYINRPISTKITKLLLKTNITPNIISLFTFLLAAIGSIFFFLGGYPNLIIGAVFAQFASIIDGCDGEIARLKMQTSEFGGWFDAVLDRYADALLLFGLTIFVFNLSPNFVMLLIGFLAIIGSFMNSYTADKYDGLMKKLTTPNSSYFRLGRDVRMIIILIGALLYVPFIVLIIIAVLMNVENIRRILLFHKHYQMISSQLPKLNIPMEYTHEDI